MNETVHYRRQGHTALIEIDNPPVNALSRAVRAGLLQAVLKARADTSVKAIALTAKGKAFIAGADIKEFGRPPENPLLSDVIDTIERSEKPVLAVIQGVALGGGLEVVLGCHYRLAFSGVHLGLPEVKLGLLPGAGGTQRLPRLVGLATSAEMITRGDALTAEQALDYGLIDRISEAASARHAALEAADRLVAGQWQGRRTGSLPNPNAEPETLSRVHRALLATSPELFSPFRILEALEASSRLPLAEGLAYERALFRQCMESPQRSALIHHFFASKAIGKIPGADERFELGQIVLKGEHPLFALLSSHSEGFDLIDRQPAERAGMAVVLVTANSSDNVAPLKVEIGLSVFDAELMDEPAGLDCTIWSTNNPKWLELVDHRQQPSVQQALVRVFNGLGFQVVPSLGSGIYPVLRAALENGGDPRPALEAAAPEVVQRGYCHRSGDIDVLAVAVLGYPRYLGGPHFQATKPDRPS